MPGTEMHARSITNHARFAQCILRFRTMAWYKREDRDDDLSEEKRSVPAGVFTKCPGCRAALLTADLEKNDNVCPQCEHHFPLSSARRFELVLDPGSFVEADGSIESVDPLGFRDSKKYSDRLRAARRTAGERRLAALRLGADRGHPGRARRLRVRVHGRLDGLGRRARRSPGVFERALERRAPALIFSASGGARMQEGVLSLMQMAKTSAALGRLREAGLPYLSILLHPTTGGVAASFAMLGDVILAEPKAQIGFAGARVIQNTIRQRLPPGFQRAEFLLEHGFLDAIVPAQGDARDAGAAAASPRPRAPSQA